jgi:hypothetical protein
MLKDFEISEVFIIIVYFFRHFFCAGRRVGMGEKMGAGPLVPV